LRRASPSHALAPFFFSPLFFNPIGLVSELERELKRIKTVAASSAAQQRTTMSLAQSDFSKIGLSAGAASAPAPAPAAISALPLRE
jgi:hypothetical protein